MNLIPQDKEFFKRKKKKKKKKNNYIFIISVQKYIAVCTH